MSKASSFSPPRNTGSRPEISGIALVGADFNYPNHQLKGWQPVRFDSHGSAEFVEVYSLFRQPPIIILAVGSSNLDHDTESRPSADVDRVIAGVAEVGLYAPLTVADADQRYSYGRMILSSGYSREGASPSSGLHLSSTSPLGETTNLLIFGGAATFSARPHFLRSIIWE